jgi:hypothetical protein
MKQFVIGLLAIMTFSNSCKTTGTMATIQPKSGTIELPAKGEFRIWKDLTHPSFSVTLSNSSSAQSCEVYKVTDNGSEKWISPSLQAGKTLTLRVPSNGHLFFKNFNDNTLKIDYKVEE